MTDAAHALLSASAAHRWGPDGCAPSLKLHAHYGSGRRSSKAADKGSVQHEVAAWCLLNEAEPDQYPNPAIEMNGVQWPITQEMKNAVAAYIAVVRERAKGGTLLVEQRVNYAFWLGVDPELAFGTCDAPILFDEEIEIVDAKFGENPNNKVYAYERGEDGVVRPNPQLVLYAAGCLYEYEHLGDFRKIRLTIVQPYLDHVSTCELDVTDLKTELLRLKAAAHRALKFYNGAQPALEDFAPSEKACQWCAAAHSCPALLASVESETRDLFGHLVFSEEPPAEPPTVIMPEVPDDVLARVMAKVPMIEDLLKAVRGEVERRLLAGHRVPGFKLIEGRKGPRSWADEDKAVKDLRRVLGAKDAVVLKPISPTQVEDKFVKRGLLTQRVWENLCKNVERSDGKPSVAPESAPGTPYVVASVEERFEALRSDLQASVSHEAAEDLV